MRATVYQSNKAGKRFEKSEIELTVYEDTHPETLLGGKHPDDVEGGQLRIYPSVEYQTFKGFGGAFTESAAYAWLAMPKNKQDEVIDKYFGADGLGYSYCRLPIGSCDFSVSAYSYVEDGDQTLDTFDVSREDNTIFRMVKEAQKREKNLTFFASPWTPPIYMKTVKEWQGGKLKKQYYELYAKYLCKYVAACRDRNIKVEAITVQNEERLTQMWESCEYSKEEELELVNSYLGEEMEKQGAKIYVYDHCKERAFERGDYAFQNSKYVSGVATHWYSGDYFDELRMLREKYPDKELPSTEACCPLPDPNPSEDKKWQCAEGYARHIIGNLNAGMTSFCDWNLVLNEECGPSHFRVGRNCVADAPVICNAATGEIEYRPSYYAIGHFSKWLKPGAKVVGLSKANHELRATAAKNPDGSVAIIISNNLDASRTIILHVEDNIARITLEPSSIYTIIYKK